MKLLQSSGGSTASSIDVLNKNKVIAGQLVSIAGVSLTDSGDEATEVCIKVDYTIPVSNTLYAKPVFAKITTDGKFYISTNTITAGSSSSD
jgi:hypothetical protein